MSEHTTTITVQTESPDLPPLILEVKFDFDPGEKPVMYFRDGTGHPGTPPHVIVNSVKCTGVDDSEGPMIDPNCRTAAIIGQLCWEAYRKQIETQVFESFSEEDAERRAFSRERDE